ncbi:MAG: putative DNA binding domain-containing protein [Gammaproteobacteria bacterium]|nr:putative DNA binding domain-containing protein [Gammaproteobacteria bacterium]
MLEALLSQEESKVLEFKENAESLNGIIRTIIAFGNTAGGTIVVGIKDKTKEAIGVKNILNEEERIANAIADSITPLITPNFQFNTWRNRDFLIISVNFAPMPYYLKSKGLEHGVYIRLGSTNRVADKATIAELHRLAIHQSFDELPNFQAKQEDIDLSLAKELFLAKGKKFDLNVAKSMHLLVSYQSTYYPSNSAILIFGKDRRHFFPDAIIQCGCFAGTTKTQIIDQQEIDLPLPNAIDQAILFIERNSSVRSEIGRIQRIDIPQYPPVVLREAIINAIVHADYSIKGGTIQIAIFSDRLEITNPGTLPYGLTLEKALSGISQLRNRVIGHIFRELSLIERWGSGLGRMIEVCQQQGITEPKFEELDNYFRVTLYHDAHLVPTKVIWQKVIINYLKQHQIVTTKDASRVWKVTERTASSRLKKMLDEGLIIEVGTGPFDPKKKFVLTK